MKNKIFLTTSEVSKLLNINEKKIYTLSQEGAIPATKVTGKWLFPYEELLNFLKYDALRNIKKGLPFSLLENDIMLAAGSDDPILPKIFSKFFTAKQNTLFYSTVGSEKGIDMLKNRIVHFAFSHLYDFETNEYNIPYLKKKFPVEDYVVINFFLREIGFVSNEKIIGFKAFKEKKYTFVLRQKGSGIRNITEKFFHNEKLKKEWFCFYDTEVTTHFDLAKTIKENQNFVGIATKSTARIFNLNFYKIFEERFDIITLKEYFFSKNFQKFYSFLNENLKPEFSSIDGYNFSETGKIIQ
jgi:excisionase family DNA binding protein